MFMRIIGGKYRSRSLLFDIDKTLTRPTKDVVREGVFSALSNYLSSTTILDLFAGSGSYGIEGLSRGAKKAIFVDSNDKSIEIIKKNIFFVEEEVIIEKADYLTYLTNYKNTETFDLVFLDPPYALDITAIVNSVIASNVLKKNAIIVAETNKKVDFQHISSNVRYYKYGITYIAIIWRSI